MSPKGTVLYFPMKYKLLNQFFFSHLDGNKMKERNWQEKMIWEYMSQYLQLLSQDNLTINISIANNFFKLYSLTGTWNGITN